MPCMSGASQRPEPEERTFVKAAAIMREAQHPAKQNAVADDEHNMVSLMMFIYHRPCRQMCTNLRTAFVSNLSQILSNGRKVATGVPGHD